MMLHDMGEYLEQKGIGALGDVLFLGGFPDDRDEAVALFEYQGQPPAQWAGMEAPGLQVCACARDDYAAARAKLEEIDRVLRRVGFEEHDETAGGVLINGTRYFRAEPALSGVMPLGPDEAGRLRLCKNYTIFKEET